MNLRVVILFPFSVLYGLILRVRHALYDGGWIHSEAGALPTLVVGNLATGGSGKTPFTEWLCAHLAGRSNIAVLSRGYGRNTKGFYWVKPSDTAQERGDEPVQISRKFPSIPVAVCEDRIKGIRQIASIHPNLNLVILDDAYQHRKLRGDINVLLTEFQR
ncbi:MAG: tetraacyldisaccharide 4'-kinase, partial [Flavobacteriales bacterium]|nr:tetraacyldisaccharide 4'-kinase [Flavobacteriales bacterium]